MTGLKWQKKSYDYSRNTVAKTICVTCRYNSTAGRDAAYPGAAYFNEHTVGHCAAYHGAAPRTMVWTGPAPTRTRLGVAPRTIVWLGAAPRTTKQPGKDTAGRRAAYNGTARRGANNNYIARRRATLNNTAWGGAGEVTAG